MQGKECRPVISKKKILSTAPNKVDHLKPDALPSSKRSLPESGRFHATSRALRPSQDAAKAVLNLFTPPPPVRASSAPRLRPEQEFRQASPMSRDSRRKSVRSINESTISLTIDDAKENTRSVSSVGTLKRPSSSIFFGGDAPLRDKWSGRRPSPQRLTSTNRVLEPSEQPNRTPRLHTCNQGGEDVRVLLRRDSPRSQSPLERPRALRTKIPPFTFDQMPTPRPSTNPRHVVAVPQPSTVFSTDQQSGLCFWDYKFSSIQKPSQHALARRAMTPEPRRQLCDQFSSVQRSGKRRIVPAYLLA